MKLPVQILVIISILFLTNLPMTTLGQYTPTLHPEGMDCDSEFIGQLCEDDSVESPYDLSNYIEWTPVDGAIDYIVDVEYGNSNASFTVSEPRIRISDLESEIPLPYLQFAEDYVILVIARYERTPSGSKLASSTYATIVDCILLAAVYKCTSGSGSGKSKINDCCGFAALDLYRMPSNSNGKSKSITPTPQNTPNLTLSPNPFQDQLKITTDLPQASQAVIHIYNATGQLVGELSNEAQLAKGTHVMEWDTSDLLPGIYYCVLKTGEETVSQKVVKY